jgi:hypothetical protein
MYRQPASLNRAVGVAVTPLESKDTEIFHHLEELGTRNVLVRFASWEREKINHYENFIDQLNRRGYSVLVALLQNRYDVLEPGRWQQFLRLAFERLSPYATYFELGHAWNRTKWGLWTFQEYLELARPAIALAGEYGVKLVGPAVIDFEFHLYPVVLKEIKFDVISSLLYVDRTGAPENAQWGWTLERKLALLRAIIDLTPCQKRPCWITEFNWPLKGMEPYSPAPGRPCVSLEEQANFLVRYFVLGLASGLVERIYWWQLVARGYGLIDPLAYPWEIRPSFRALQTLQRFLDGSTFLGREFHFRAWIFHFERGKQRLAVVWTKKGSLDYRFNRPVSQIFDRDGQALALKEEIIKIEARPKYVFFETDSL